MGVEATERELWKRNPRLALDGGWGVINLGHKSQESGLLVSNGTDNIDLHFFPTRTTNTSQLVIGKNFCCFEGKKVFASQHHRMVELDRDYFIRP